MNTFIINARTLARKSGLIRLINRLRPSRPYEDKFHHALVEAVRPGDVVWDVGANVGLYTEQFCQWTGPEGMVVAFEPGRESVAKIRQRIPDCAWLRIEHAALSEENATGTLILSADSVNHRLQSGADSHGVGADTVTIHRGDTICDAIGRVPNVIKIDVESFEEEVLKGLTQTLAQPALRTVLVEVHFSQLADRGQAHAPVRIEKMLREKGFQLKWVDTSHLVATRS